MKVLVTGANGFVGTAACAALAREHVVRAATRRPSTVPLAHEHVVVGDATATTDWSTALEGIDAVIHLAARVHVLDDAAADPLSAFRAVNVGGTKRLAEQALARGVRRFVFVSSMKVNGDETVGGAPFVETGAGPSDDPYGGSKWEAEEALRELSAREPALEIAVVRPPLVYGPGVKANFLRLVQLVDRGVPLPFGSVRNRRSLVAVDNLADALRVAATHPAAAGESFQVADREVVSTGDLIRRIARALGRPARLLPIPGAALRLGATLARRPQLIPRLLGSFELDTTKIRTRLGWEAPKSMDDALLDVTRWYRGHGA